MDKVKETIGSRKFWFSMLVMTLAVALFVAGQIDIDRMLEVVRWAAGIYVGALSVEDAAKRMLIMAQQKNNIELK